MLHNVRKYQLHLQRSKEAPWACVPAVAKAQERVPDINRRLEYGPSIVVVVVVGRCRVGCKNSSVFLRKMLFVRPGEAERVIMLGGRVVGLVVVDGVRRNADEDAFGDVDVAIEFDAVGCRDLYR